MTCYSFNIIDISFQIVFNEINIFNFSLNVPECITFCQHAGTAGYLLDLTDFMSPSLALFKIHLRGKITLWCLIDQIPLAQCAVPEKILLGFGSQINLLRGLLTPLSCLLSVSVRQNQ